MKISELNQKTFLSGPSAATQSYVLINYEDDNTSKPITYRATVDELGKAIANNLKLYKADNSGGARTISTSQGAYVDDGRKYFVNSSEKTKIANMPQFDSAHNIGYDNNGTFTPVIYAPTDSALASLYIDTSNNSIHKIDSEGDRLMITGIALNECPLVVYSSTEGTIGYFDVDDSEFQAISVGGGGTNVLQLDNSSNIQVDGEPMITGVLLNECPLVVYDPAQSALGYFAMGESELSPIGIGGGGSIDPRQYYTDENDYTYQFVMQDTDGYMCLVEPSSGDTTVRRELGKALLCEESSGSYIIKIVDSYGYLNEIFTITSNGSVTMPQNL